jgi:hypothetical protein
VPTSRYNPIPLFVVGYAETYVAECVAKRISADACGKDITLAGGSSSILCSPTQPPCEHDRFEQSFCKRPAGDTCNWTPARFGGFFFIVSFLSVGRARGYLLCSFGINAFITCCSLLSWDCAPLDVSHDSRANLTPRERGRALRCRMVTTRL